MNASKPKGIIPIFLRIFIVMAVVLFSATAATAQTHRGEKTFGIKAGYVSKNQSAIAGLVFEYSFSRHFRIAPQLGVVVRHNDRDAFTAAVDTHYPIALGSEKIDFYPMVGLGFNSWTQHYKDELTENVDVLTRYNRLGLNVGGGFDFRPSKTLKVRLEYRYTLNDSFSHSEITAGIAYVF